MDNKIKALFSSELGKEVYRGVIDTMDRYSMDIMMRNGVLLALSGGADSVFLACFLHEYRRRTSPFPVIAVHVNHGIRGAEADRDEAFSRTLSAALGFEFSAERVDVPVMASELGIGLEEAARNARYSIFSDIICGRSDVSCIATAHNSTDNAETVIFNIARGSGTRGGAGIAPVRDNIIRPLIKISKSEISELLTDAGVEYVTDSTNFSIDYSRNYIRHEILPHLARINPNFEEAFSSFSQALRDDEGYITSSLAVDLANAESEELDRGYLLGLPPSAFVRVLSAFASFGGVPSIQRRHLIDLRRLLSQDNFRYSLSGNLTFVCERGVCRIVSERENVLMADFEQALELGDNPIPGFDGTIRIAHEKQKTSPNVYRIFIQATIPSAIINGGMYVRFKRDGDAYRYGGMTRKLKKVFNDKEIPPSHRGRIPIVCDESGILWVPGLGVRDGNAAHDGKKIYISFFAPEAGDGEELYAAFKEP